MKKAALTGAGVAGVGIGLPLLSGEKEAVSDPHDSYWALERPADNLSLQGDLAVDVAIIGGGYTGLFTAWHLAKSVRGLNIVVLAARQVGHGGSGRQGGMVLPQTGVESFEIAHDLEPHRQMYDLTVKGMRSLQQVVTSTGVKCDSSWTDMFMPFWTKKIGIPTSGEAAN